MRLEEYMGELLSDPEGQCIACKAHLIAADRPVFVVTKNRYLCAPCAVSRGGRFDPMEANWDPPPTVDDLDLTPRHA